MADYLSMYLAAQRAFGERVHAVRGDQWSLPTPDTDWDVAALVAHVTDEDRWVSPLIHGQDLETAGKIVVGMGPLDAGGLELVREWDTAAVSAAEAFSEAGALERSVALSRGPTPAADYLGEMIFDHLVHAWDLGKAIGFDGPLPGDVIEAVYGMAKSMGDLSAFGDMFKPAVSVPDDASTLDKLVALTGRDPR